MHSAFSCFRANTLFEHFIFFFGTGPLHGSATYNLEAYILTQRVMGLRRILAKYSQMQSNITYLITSFQDARDCNATVESPAGPIGLLMRSLEQAGAKLSSDLVISKECEADISLKDMPWQHLKKSIADLAAHQRAANATKDRTHLEGLEEVDYHMVKKVMANLGPKEQRIYNHISIGGAWSEAHLEEIGLSDGKCVHCGQEVQDICQSHGIVRKSTCTERLTTSKISIRTYSLRS